MSLILQVSNPDNTIISLIDCDVQRVERIVFVERHLLYVYTTVVSVGKKKKNYVDDPRHCCLRTDIVQSIIISDDRSPAHIPSKYFLPPITKRLLHIFFFFYERVQISRKPIRH